jgi:hypothetical protein
VKVLRILLGLVCVLVSGAVLGVAMLVMVLGGCTWREAWCSWERTRKDFNREKENERAAAWWRARRARRP